MVFQGVLLRWPLQKKQGTKNVFGRGTCMCVHVTGGPEMAVTKPESISGMLPALTCTRCEAAYRCVTQRRAQCQPRCPLGGGHFAGIL